MYSTGYHDHGTPAASGAKLVTLEINGKAVTVPDGTSIMRAAASAGTDIPKLCATDSLKAFGSCRLCLVEIEGRRGYPASCTTLVADGIKVSTQSHKLTQLRNSVMELYLSDHPTDCGSTSASARCDVHDMAAKLGITKNTPGAALNLPIGGIGGLDDGVLIVPNVTLKTPIESKGFDVLMAIELKDMSSLIQTELSGVLGYDSLKDYRITLDYHKAEIRLTK